MNRRARSVSILDNVLFNLCYLVPMGLQGTFTRNRFWVAFWSRVHPDPAAVRFVSWLRRKHGCERLFVRMLTARSLLVLDQDGVCHVLSRSPLVYADGRQKREGMRVFQPYAVTISRGNDWLDRRRFNEAVLSSDQPLHPYTDNILRIIRQEMLDPVSGSGPKLQVWDDFDQLFARIARQVIYGRAARNDAELTDLLKQMMIEANGPFRPRKSRHFDTFYSHARAYLDAAEPDTLVALCKQVPSSARTSVENQIPHWTFAMWETLGANTVRALAAILAHPLAEQRVRGEMAASDLRTARGIGQLKYLEGCVQEAMRLWPTTPMLVRETVADDSLGETRLRSGTQVLIWNSFNHRDRERYPLADTFAPETWANGSPNPLFNHLSSGPQVCAGADLGLFMSKAVIALILSRERYVLKKPRIDPTRPMPYAYNYFDVQLSPRGA